MSQEETSAIRTEIYFEKQPDDSGLCGQHAINNLLQGPYFTAFELAAIGQKLDERENVLYQDNDINIINIEKSDGNVGNTGDGNSMNGEKQKYTNVSMEGFFSIEVLVEILHQSNLTALPLTHPDVADVKDHPEKEEGFICYQMAHWISLRKIENQWYNLNSSSSYIGIEPQPVKISEFLLSAMIHQLKEDGFQVFVVRGKYPILGREAAHCDNLKGTYSWSSSRDIQTHGDLTKLSRQMQEKEREKKRQNGQKKRNYYQDCSSDDSNEEENRRMNFRNNVNYRKPNAKGENKKTNTENNKTQNNKNNTSHASFFSKFFSTNEKPKSDNNNNIENDNDDEEFQLALAMSQSIAEAKKNNICSNSDQKNNQEENVTIRNGSNEIDSDTLLDEVGNEDSMNIENRSILVNNDENTINFRISNKKNDEKK